MNLEERREDPRPVERCANCRRELLGQPHERRFCSRECADEYVMLYGDLTTN
jgi:hypothetical protein